MFSCIVFYDVSKAFDRVWHAGLLFKVGQNGINGNVLEWLSSCLSHREQKVCLRAIWIIFPMRTIPVSRNRKSCLSPIFLIIFDFGSIQFSDTLMLNGYFPIFLTDESN